jgi:hypothetical protein
MTTPQQLPNESHKAFDAFKKYVAMGAKRSIRKCAQKLNRSPTIIARFSKRHRWQSRLREMNLADTKRSAKAAEVAALDVAKERERQRTRFIERAMEASEKAMERALEILRQPMRDTRPDAAAKLLSAAHSIGASVHGLNVSSGTGAFALKPIAPPVINVIHRRGENNDLADADRERFIKEHPDHPVVVRFVAAHKAGLLPDYYAPPPNDGDSASA